MPQGTNFVDYVKICCRSGHGGAGATHWHRDRLTTKGGPDGGDGGRGGHIILRANAQLWTLLHLKYQKHLVAGNGASGGGALKTGKNGKDVLVEVPLGTIVKDAHNKTILVDLKEDGATSILVKGGRGGLGNWHFKSATQRSPRFAQPGEPGKEVWHVLELQILADVGLVGFPNAGKSTLLSVLSAAKPKIAPYPFTTTVPNLGLVAYQGNRSFVMADIPGIVEGAAQGKGLGLRFLRHIERNTVLLLLIPADTNRMIVDEYYILLKELTAYNPSLMQKPRVLAITKSDLLDRALQRELNKQLPKGTPSIFISSVTGAGIVELKHLLWRAMNRH